MKIVNRTEFLKLPSNTLFSEYESGHFGDLKIKGATIEPNDFQVQYLNSAVECDSSEDFFSILEHSQQTGESFSMDFNCLSRDGLYDSANKLYAVWEEVDIQQLIVRFANLLK